MEITEVKVFPVDEDKLKAYVTIILDNCFVVRDLKIIKGNTGLFVAMPSKKRKDGVYKDIAHPLNQSTRTVMEKKILDAYLAEIKRPGSVAISGGGGVPDDGIDSEQGDSGSSSGG